MKHHESRMLPVYVVTVSKSGLKLKESPNGPVPEVGKRLVPGKPDELGFPVLPPGYSGVVAGPANGTIRVKGQVSASQPVQSARQALEGLGLKFDLQTRPYDVIVIDALEKTPTEN